MTLILLLSCLCIHCCYNTMIFPLRHQQNLFFILFYSILKSLTKDLIHSQGMQDTGRANHSAHCCRQGGAVDPDGDKRRPYVYFLEEPVVLNQQSPEAEEGT